jgi:hypothetical protein
MQQPAWAVPSSSDIVRQKASREGPSARRRRVVAWSRPYIERTRLRISIGSGQVTGAKVELSLSQRSARRPKVLATASAVPTKMISLPCTRPITCRSCSSSQRLMVGTASLGVATMSRSVKRSM